jgi:hypothetical protein
LVRIGFEGDYSIRDFSKSVGEESLVGTYINSGPAADHQISEDVEFRLSRASFFCDAPPVEK